MGLDACLCEALLGSRMNGKNDRDLGSYGVNCSEEFGEFFGRVDIRRTMKSEDAEAVPVCAFFSPRSSPMEDFCAMGRKWRRESIMTLPTR